MDSKRLVPILDNKGSVYCINCEHFRHVTQQCEHPSNITLQKTWVELKKRIALKAEYMNKNNNCEKYSQRSKPYDNSNTTSE